MLPLERLEFCFWVITINSGLITSDDGLHKFWIMIHTIQHVLANFFLKLLLFLCQQLGNKFLPTPSAFTNPQLGWNELSQCLFPLPQLFLSLLHNDHSALLHGLDPSPPCFSLCMASLSGVHSPLTLGYF